MDVSDKSLEKALEEFVIDNSDLERLEDLLSEVNLFEAIGAVRSEIRHSDFLAFLLDPNQNHGLRDLFLKRLVQRAISDAETVQKTVSPIELDGWDLDDTLVWREQDNTDILLVNKRLSFAVVIENKIFSREHSNQLERYRQRIAEQHRDFRIVYIFLTVMGDEPSDPHYASITYDIVCEILERLVNTRAANLGQEILVLLRHYTGMLRRHFMEDSKLVDLAQTIYARHRIALDYIFEQRPDRQSEVSDYLKEQVQSNSDLVLDHCSKSYVRFAVRRWDLLPGLRSGSGWTPTNRLLLFDFKNFPNKLKLDLVIGPGDPQVRQKLFDIANGNRPLFRPVSSTLTTKYAQIWSRPFANSKELEESEWSEIITRVNKAWEQFTHSDLPKLTNCIEKLAE